MPRKVMFSFRRTLITTCKAANNAKPKTTTDRHFESRIVLRAKFWIFRLFHPRVLRLSWWLSHTARRRCRFNQAKPKSEVEARVY